jgi:ribosomal protein S3
MRKISLWGIQLRVAGKLDGRMRKSKYHYNIGKVQLQTLKTFLNYSISISYTKFGIISIKF